MNRVGTLNGLQPGLATPVKLDARHVGLEGRVQCGEPADGGDLPLG